MTDDPIQAEAEEMAETLAYRAATSAVEFIGTGEHRVKDLVSYLKPQFAIALRRQREEGAREERERIEEYILDWRKDGLRLRCKPGVNLNDGLDDLRWLLNYIRARGEKP